MTNPFFDHPILNSPYAYPARHWELDDEGQPTQQIIESRRRAEFITPIPKPRKRKGSGAQQQMVFDEGKGLSTPAQQYDHTAIINAVRQQVDQWRSLPHPTTGTSRPKPPGCSSIGGITSSAIFGLSSARWRRSKPPSGSLRSPRTLGGGKLFPGTPGQCQPRRQPGTHAPGAETGHRRWQDHRHGHADCLANHQCGAPAQQQKFTRGFLIVAPGLTIRDRLRVLQPNDPDSYYASRELIPSDMLGDLERAKIVITNYHAFKLRERYGTLQRRSRRCSRVGAKRCTRSKPRGRCCSA